MQKAMNISYEIGNKLYLNITNKCPCNCTFCIRNNGDGAYGSDPLWLEHQPTIDEVIANLKTRDLDSYAEIIFCGYGEPTCELEILKTTAAYIRSVSKTPIRLNTNGLGNLVNSTLLREQLFSNILTCFYYCIELTVAIRWYGFWSIVDMPYKILSVIVGFRQSYTVESLHQRSTIAIGQFKDFHYLRHNAILI